MRQATFNRVLGLTSRRPETPPGAIFVRTEGVGIHVIHTGAEDPLKALAIMNEIKHDVLRRYGPEAFHDVGQVVGCEVVNILNDVSKTVDPEQKRKFMVELTTYAIALQQIEGSPYVEVIHYPKEQMTTLQPLKQLTAAQAAMYERGAQP